VYLGRAVNNKNVYLGRVVNNKNVHLGRMVNNKNVYLGRMVNNKNVYLGRVVNNKNKRSRGGEIFRTRPERPWGPLSLLYNGYRVLPGGKAAEAWF
jgi:hypothetical protein